VIPNDAILQLALLNRGAIEAAPAIASLIKLLRKSREHIVEPILPIPDSVSEFRPNAFEQVPRPLLRSKLRIGVSKHLQYRIFEWQLQLVFGYDEHLLVKRCSKVQLRFGQPDRMHVRFDEVSIQ
jgi:hypothetical protein